MAGSEQAAAADGMPACGAVAGTCLCARPAHDPGEAHACECGGSWLDGDGGFEVLSWPGSAPGWAPPG